MNNIKFKLSDKGEALYNKLEDALDLVDSLFDEFDTSEMSFAVFEESTCNINSFIYYCWGHFILFDDEGTEKEYLEFDYILEEIEWMTPEKLTKLLGEHSEYFEDC